MIKTLKFVALLLSLISFHGLSAEWLSDVEIKTIEVQANGRIYMWLDKPVPDIGCNGKGHWLEFEKDSSNFGEQYSLALAAYMANKKVTVTVDGCGHHPYAQMIRFEFQK